MSNRPCAMPPDFPTSWKHLDQNHSDLYEPKKISAAGFSRSASGFHSCAEVRFFKGEPIVAWNWDWHALTGFSIAKKWRRKGIATALLAEWLDDEGGKMRVCCPNKKLTRILQRIGEVTPPDGEGFVTVTRKKQLAIFQ